MYLFYMNAHFFQIRYFHTWLWSTLSLLVGERKITTVRKSVSIGCIFITLIWYNLISSAFACVDLSPSPFLLPAVEFPAVLLDTSSGEVESEFHTYVQPQEHPVLSEFCTELTGITQVVTPDTFTYRNILAHTPDCLIFAR